MKTRIVLTLFWVSVTMLLVSTSTNFYLEKISRASQFLELAFLACKISLIANFWVFKLTTNDGLFSFVKAFLYSLADTYVYREGKANQERLQLTQDLLKPLVSCEICVGSNICVWVYASLSRTNFVFMDFLFLISVTAFITILTSKSWQK